MPKRRKSHHAKRNLCPIRSPQAKGSKEVELEDFLKSALPLVEAEPETLNWFAIQFEDGTCAIFDAFPDEGARNDHLSGKVAEALMQHAPELLAEEPTIEKADVLASISPKA